jgi:DNA-directed RNA polymerase specialized sigma24 family protein
MNLTLVVDNQQPQKEAYSLIEKHCRENWNNLVSRYTFFLKSKERAEDTVQEAYVRALTYWPDAPADETDFARWFHVILSNALKDNHREEITKGATSAREKAEEGQDGPAIPAIIYRQVVQRIEAKPENQAKVLSLALLHQHRPGDIEAMVPESAVTIRKMISRFRKEIRNEFGYDI